MQNNMNKQTIDGLEVIPIFIRYDGKSKSVYQSGFSKPNGFAYSIGRGYCVIDVDTKNDKDGFASLRESGIVLDEATVICKTPCGGRHYYYLTNKDIKSGSDFLGIGVDVKSEGSIIIIPDTCINGYGRYEWINSPANAQIKPLPVKVADLLDTIQEKGFPVNFQAGDKRLIDLTAKQKFWVDFYLDKVRTAGQGSRSQADFAFLVWCIKVRLSVDEIYTLVEDAGKFGERGRSYFEFSYRNALRAN